MKKLYKKGQVHPSLPSVADHLALLPATILTLTAALSAEDKEVLAYLIISCSNTSTNNLSAGHSKTRPPKSTGGDDHGGGIGGGAGAGGEHSPMFQCNCFRCYMSFWARWDASPSRELIHEIIEAYEEELHKKKKKRSAKIKKERRNKRACDDQLEGSGDQGLMVIRDDQLGDSVSVDVSEGGDEVEILEKGSVRKIVSFIGERIWGVWNRV